LRPGDDEKTGSRCFFSFPIAQNDRVCFIPSRDFAGFYSIIFEAVKEFILKPICQESSQNHGQRRHDFQLKMHQKRLVGAGR